MTMEAFHERLSSLEKRVALLESGTDINNPEARYEARYTELSTKYGQHVSKSCAAEIIGVTRATVYAMLKGWTAGGRLLRQARIDSEHCQVSLRRERRKGAEISARRKHNEGRST